MNTFHKNTATTYFNNQKEVVAYKVVHWKFC